MKYRIVSDSSSNVFALNDVAYASAPLKIRTQDKEYIDTHELDTAQMVEDLRNQTGPTSSSCPNTYEWRSAFGDGERIFALTISSALSGSYAAAVQAAQEYMQANKDAKVCVLDSLSAGPELRLTIERLREYILAGDSFEAIEKKIRAYQKHTHVIFSLRSMMNLARNGRVNPTVAKIAGALGIVIIGKGSDDGKLKPMHKCRGEKKSLLKIIDDMKEAGFSGGRVRIAHCLNPESAIQLKALLLMEFPESDIQIEPCAGLCSYYAEKGGLIIGYEDKLTD